MKNSIWSMAAAILMLTALVSCKGDADAPKAAAASFMKALMSKDIDGAAQFATKDSKPSLDNLKDVMTMANGKMKELGFDKEWKNVKVTYGEPKIEGDDAKVSMLVDGKEEMSISLRKENGSWKVAMDKTFQSYLASIVQNADPTKYDKKLLSLYFFLATASLSHPVEMEILHHDN